MRFQQLEHMLEEEQIVFLSYGGSMTQPLISGMTDALEKEVNRNDVGMKASHDIFTVFIELSQNMMNYAKGHPEFNDSGLIIVGLTADHDSYYVTSRNKVGPTAKMIIEQRLHDIEGLDKESLRKLYREKRKEGKRVDGQGAGIGFIEIARRSDQLEHHFQDLDSDSYYFTARAIIKK